MGNGLVSVVGPLSRSCRRLAWLTVPTLKTGHCPGSGWLHSRFTLDILPVHSPVQDETGRRQPVCVPCCHAGWHSRAAARLERFHLSCSEDILVCGLAGPSCPVFRPPGSGDWKVARTRRPESLRYIITVNALFADSPLAGPDKLD
jgi:hypothetical protein